MQTIMNDLDLIYIYILSNKINGIPDLWGVPLNLQWTYLEKISLCSQYFKLLTFAFGFISW